jgi:hypothetical protein
MLALDSRVEDQMGEPRDLEFDRPPVFEPPPSRPRGPLLAGVGLLLFLAGLALLVWYMRRGPQTGTTGADAPAASQGRTAQPQAEPLGTGAPDDIELPPLDESDSLVRRLVGGISSHPGVAAWLATDGLIRNATVAVQNVAAGPTPARHLRALAPSGRFSVRQDGGQATIDPRSYDRYNWVTDAFASIDAAGAAQVYTTLKPRFEDAYRDLGFPDTPFDSALERAIVTLLETPIPTGDVPVVPKGGTWAFADARLEGLTGAQKQLVRMGPRNAARVKQTLREIAAALGIPAERLPAQAGDQ